MASPAERFLKVHRSEIVGRVKSVNGLADCLLEKEVISKEALNEISSQKPEEEQMRTVYKHLNSSKAYELTLEWLKVHEPHVIEDLEKTETPEPSHSREKRQRIQNHEAVDETDRDLQTSPDLKTLSTMAKLDDWVSDPKISQKLVDDLKEKLAQGEMEGLEDYLKDIKLKKSLCLTAKEINEIRQRKDLRSFLTDVKGAKFPKNTLNHFFEVRSNASTAKKKPEQYSDNNKSTKHKAKLSLNADQIQQAVRTSGATEEFKEKQEMVDTVQNSDQAYCPPQTKLEDVPPNSLRQDLQLQSEDSGRLKDTQRNSSEELKKASFCTSSLKNPKPKKKTRRNVEGQPNRRIEQYNAVLCDWLMNQCDGSEEEFKKLFDRISVKHVAEHSEYPFFIAENVTVFKNPQTGEEQIIVVKDEKKYSTETTSLIHYQMFVCDIQKTVLLGSKEPKEKQIGFEEFEDLKNRCLRSILEVFAPALAVFKNIQRKERLDSYLKTIEGRKENPR